MNTFGFAQRAANYVEVDNDEQLLAAVAIARENQWPLQILGGGSNLVLTRDIPGLTIRMTGDAIVYEKADSEHSGSVIATVQAGTSWHAFVLDSLAHGFSGLENLSLIPGTVGAAPVQNIGAYGVELSERFLSLDAWHVDRQSWVTLDAGHCQFAYRNSVFKQNPGEYIITRVRLALSQESEVNIAYAGLQQRLQNLGIEAPTPSDVSKAVIDIRSQKLPDPAKLGNAGSFFQNPVVDAALYDELSQQFPDMVSYKQADGRVKLAAAWLIDSLGFKGVSREGVGVHQHQALVLVHHGGATGKQLIALADEIIQAVFDRYRITLVPEPVII